MKQKDFKKEITTLSFAVLLSIANLSYAQRDTATDVVEVTTLTGRVWMDRNLGATQAATSSSDADSYGDIYQWGRGKDGHESRTSTTAAGPVAAGSEGSDFITRTSNNRDWLSTQDHERWQANHDTYTPCPVGYMVPTDAEWEAEVTAFIGSDTNNDNDVEQAFNSALKISASGQKNRSGVLGGVGVYARFWTSRAFSTGELSVSMYIRNGSLPGGDPQTRKLNAGRNFGAAVRCIKDATLSLEENVLKVGFKMYPNPITEGATLEFLASNKVTDIEVLIYDITGRLVHTQKEVVKSMVLPSHITTGIYLAKFVLNEGKANVVKELIVR
ncbi:FISUMP domain-containing protein [Flavivirga amylovorans]|uniref:FISUMP domain-containing protein n=1 Tax=Flavivirga amylovorans TaxID=870486 RepID=A0ABT8WX34_9FLAO|nr:T9SS type A sorting domain-containing protein [Flavivirga amylovorans]MDO5986238.1 FISUMP domain-containing protein [Flavivirga amylovorans]